MSTTTAALQPDVSGSTSSYSQTVVYPQNTQFVGLTIPSVQYLDWANVGFGPLVNIDQMNSAQYWNPNNGYRLVLSKLVGIGSIPFNDFLFTSSYTGQLASGSIGSMSMQQASGIPAGSLDARSWLRSVPGGSVYNLAYTDLSNTLQGYPITTFQPLGTYALDLTTFASNFA